MNIPPGVSTTEYQKIATQLVQDVQTDFALSVNITIFSGDVPSTSDQITSKKYQIFSTNQDEGSSFALSYFSTSTQTPQFSMDRSPIAQDPGYPYYIQIQPSVNQEFEAISSLFTLQQKNVYVAVISCYQDSDVEVTLKVSGLNVAHFFNFKANDNVTSVILQIVEFKATNILLLSHDVQQTASFLNEAWIHSIYGKQYFWVTTDGSIGMELYLNKSMNLTGHLAVVPTQGYGSKYQQLLAATQLSSLSTNSVYLYDSLYFSAALIHYIQTGCSSECACPTNTSGPSFLQVINCLVTPGTSGDISFDSRTDRIGVFSIYNWDASTSSVVGSFVDGNLTLTHPIITTGFKTPITLALLFIKSLPNDTFTQLCEAYIPAIQYALDNINNSPDILTDYTLLAEPFWYSDSQSALLQSFTISNLGFFPGVLGAITSGVTATTQLVFNAFEVPQFSGSATSPNLSDKGSYAFFGRNVPSDAFQARALAKIVHHFGWDQVATLNSNDDYGTAGFRAFADEADQLGLTLSGLQTFQAGTKDPAQMKTQMQRLKATSVRVFFLFALNDECIAAIKAAQEEGIMGPGYTWLISDGCRTLEWNTIKPLVGAFSCLPWAGQGSQARADMFTAIGRTDNDTTPFVYGEFYHDLIWVYATAFDMIMKAGGDIYNGTQVKNAMFNVNVTGVTGVNAFDSNLDRAGGSVLYLLSYLSDDQNSKWVEFGNWTQATDVVIKLDPVFSDGSTTPPPDFLYNIDQNEWNQPVSIVIGILAGIGILLTVIVTIIIFVSKETAVVKAASPLFLYVILFGIFCGYCSIYVFLGKPTRSACILQPWLAGLSFVIIYSAILTKTYRIYKIFDNTQLVKLKMSNQVLVKYGFFFLAIEIIINILWTVIDPAHPNEEHLSLTATGTEVRICTGKHYWPFLGVYLAYKGAMLLLGVSLCWWVRQVITLYNESKQVAFATYNIFLFAVLLLPIYFSMRGLPDAALAILGAAFLLCNTGTLLILFLPKLYVIFLRGGGSQQARTTGQTQSYRDSAIKNGDDE